MIIDLQERDRGENELIVLSAELADRALQGASAASDIAKLARRIFETAETLTKRDD
jgi:hypothetical protein